VIVMAGLLVLGGLGLFVAGVLTGVTTFYWACVGACVVAAVLLFLARRRMTEPAAPAAPAGAVAARTSSGANGTSTGRHAGSDPADAARTAPAADAAAAATAAATATGTADDAGRAVPPAAAPSTGNGASASTGAAAQAEEPPVEEVEVTDLLLVVDLKDDVLVVDEHPRYHVAGCRHLDGQDSIPIPMDEARTDGFTPCGTCRPDATLADRVRAERTSGG
jgi:hypothetical protein